jgi:hypothetical protein
METRYSHTYTHGGETGRLPPLAADYAKLKRLCVDLRRLGMNPSPLPAEPR